MLIAMHKDNNKRTPLHDAASIHTPSALASSLRDGTAALAELLDCHADVELKDAMGNTALHTAALASNIASLPQCNF